MLEFESRAEAVMKYQEDGNKLCEPGFKNIFKTPKNDSLLWGKYEAKITSKRKFEAS